MIANLIAILAGILLLIGAAFALVGALGILRLPDALSRMHAASKAGTLGSGFCLLAVAVSGPQFDVVTRALVAVAFFILTAPISAHLLARAALLAGYPPNCSINDYPATNGSQSQASDEKDQF